MTKKEQIEIILACDIECECCIAKEICDIILAIANSKRMEIRDYCREWLATYERYDTIREWCKTKPIEKCFGCKIKKQCTTIMKNLTVDRLPDAWTDANIERICDYIMENKND